MRTSRSGEYSIGAWLVSQKDFKGTNITVGWEHDGFKGNSNAECYPPELVETTLGREDLMGQQNKVVRKCGTHVFALWQQIPGEILSGLSDREHM